MGLYDQTNGDSWRTNDGWGDSDSMGDWYGVETSEDGFVVVDENEPRRDDVWAVGQGGLILHFGGDSWEELESNTTEYLRAIWGSQPG